MNKPRVPVNNYNIDGALPFGIRTDPGRLIRAEQLQRPGGEARRGGAPHTYGGEVRRYDYRGRAAHYSQPGALFRLFSDEEKAPLFRNTAEAIQGVPDFIVERQLGHLDKADPAYGAGVREALARQARDDAGASLSTSHTAVAE